MQNQDSIPLYLLPGYKRLPAINFSRQNDSGKIVVLTDLYIIHLD
jgi:hypothetical protein